MTQTPLRPPAIIDTGTVAHHAQDLRGAIVAGKILDTTLAEADRAFGRARLQVERAIEQAKAFDNDPTASPEATQDRKRRSLPPYLSNAQDALDHGLAVVAAELAQLDATLAPQRPKTAEEASYARELRSELKHMGQEARDRAIAKALDDGDELLIFAIAGGAPALLTGLSSDRIALIRDNWGRSRHPETYARRKVLGRTSASLEQGKADLGGFSSKLIPQANMRQELAARAVAAEEESRRVAAARGGAR